MDRGDLMCPCSRANEQLLWVATSLLAQDYDCLKDIRLSAEGVSMAKGDISYVSREAGLLNRMASNS